MGTKTNYLLLYNTACFILWTYLTLKTLATLPASLTDLPTRRLLSHTLLSPALAGTQSLAGLEVLHAAAGLVRASPLTTAIQVGGKNLVVWTVMLAFPDLLEGEAGSWGFLGCLLAWGCSEMIRYGFFVVQLSSADGRTPRWLRWLRYSSFIPLYPLGFLSEASLVYISYMQATGIGPLYRGYLLAGLLAYIPAGYILYTHMLAQRRRVLK